MLPTGREILIVVDCNQSNCSDFVGQKKGKWGKNEGEKVNTFLHQKTRETLILQAFRVFLLRSIFCEKCRWRDLYKTLRKP